MSWLLRTSTSHQGLIPWLLSWSLNVATNSLNLQSLWISSLLGFCLFVCLIIFGLLWVFCFIFLIPPPVTSSAVAAETMGPLCSPSPALSSWASIYLLQGIRLLISLTSPYGSKGKTISSFTPISSHTVFYFLSSFLCWDAWAVTLSQ